MVVKLEGENLTRVSVRQSVKLADTVVESGSSKNKAEVKKNTTFYSDIRQLLKNYEKLL